MRSSKLYPCFGEMITVNEAARRVHVSVPTLRNRLRECGGSMEEVFNFYRRKEEEWKENQTRMTRKEDAAAEQIMKALCGTDTPEPDMSDAVDPAETEEIKTAPPVALATEAVQIITEKKVLRAYNRAIRALGQMEIVGSEDVVLNNRMREMREELMAHRNGRFGHLVDWDQLEKDMEE